MWALGLIVGALIGAFLAQGAGALVGAIVGVAVGIVVGQQRKGVKSRIETLESQILNLETRISALDERWSVARSVSTATGGTAAPPASASAPADAFTEAPSPARVDTVPGAIPAAAFVSRGRPSWTRSRSTRWCRPKHGPHPRCRYAKAAGPCLQPVAPRPRGMCRHPLHRPRRLLRRRGWHGSWAATRLPGSASCYCSSASASCSSTRRNTCTLRSNCA